MLLINNRYRERNRRKNMNKVYITTEFVDGWRQFEGNINDKTVLSFIETCLDKIIKDSKRCSVNSCEIKVNFKLI